MAFNYLCTMKKLPILLAFFVLAACRPKKEVTLLPESELPPVEDTIAFEAPKNIVLMIGDGMGLTQITAGLYMNGNKLNLEEFKYIGLHKSYASDNLITDSAAGATALSCGIKTYNGAIGVDANGKRAKTILEEAEAANYSTGLVVTSSITHATPASFFAHQKQRTMMEAIAADMTGSGVDFFVGGGKKYFDRRLDERDVIKELKGNGYVISNFIEANFADLSIDFNKKFGYFTADAEPLPKSQGRDYLAQACQSALTYLSSQNSKGFFLMVEGSQIDWGGHANNSDYIISEMIDFDEAIGVVMNFAKENGETLVIVTADHETGGYALNPGSTWDSIHPAFTTDQHTAALIPVFAYGPGEVLFSGVYENTAIYEKMKKALGFLRT
jgi:alkaline phosphatase